MSVVSVVSVVLKIEILTQMIFFSEVSFSLKYQVSVQRTQKLQLYVQCETKLGMSIRFILKASAFRISAIWTWIFLHRCRI